jgi:hypothetical protein
LDEWQKKPAISNGFFTSLDFLGLCPGGDEGDRTPGLGVANAALSQLSYIPIFINKNGVAPNSPAVSGGAYMIRGETVKG